MQGGRRETSDENSPIGAWVALPLLGFVRLCQRCRQASATRSGRWVAGGGDRGQRGVVRPRGRAPLLPAEADIKGARSRSGQMRPPSLLSLTLDSALLRIAHIADLSNLPDHLVIDLFRRTLSAGKLTEKVLKLFLATGCEEIILAVQLLNIKQPLVPVLPTRCSERF